MSSECGFGIAYLKADGVSRKAGEDGAVASNELRSRHGSGLGKSQLLQGLSDECPDLIG